MDLKLRYCKCGIRQGCRLSPPLLLIAVEILAIKTSNSSEKEGIEMEEQAEKNSLKRTSKIKHFAYDTTLTMKNEEDVK